MSQPTDYSTSPSSGYDDFDERYAAEGNTDADTPLAESDDEELSPQSRGVGCSWPVLFILMAVIALVGGGYWGVRWVNDHNMLERLNIILPGASLLPGPRVDPLQPDQQVHLYYIAHGRTLAPITFKLPHSASGSERIHLIAKNISKPPTSDLYESPLPPGVQIRGVYLIDGSLWLDLSAEFLTPANASPLREQLTIYGIVNSFLLNDKTASGVRFMVDGKPIQSAWGWMDLSSPLSPNLIE